MSEPTKESKGKPLPKELEDRLRNLKAWVLRTWRHGMDEGKAVREYVVLVNSLTTQGYDVGKHRHIADLYEEDYQERLSGVRRRAPPEAFESELCDLVGKMVDARLTGDPVAELRAIKTFTDIVTKYKRKGYDVIKREKLAALYEHDYRCRHSKYSK